MAKPAKPTILIPYTRNGEPFSTRLYWLNGPLAVTRNHERDGYGLTHVPTCYRIAKFESKAHAIRCAKKLRRTFRWETLTEEWFRDLPEEDVRAIGLVVGLLHYATSAEGLKEAR